MVDLVNAVCNKCGGKFKVWLARGEIAPALCLGCWWQQPGNECLGPDSVRTAAEQSRDDASRRDVNVGEEMLPGTVNLSPRRRGKNT
jgi:hypothetical protein